jgi:uncharacterized membrane protein YtjA (UPF0391 family)
MIDWGNLAANSAWILGCAIALAAVSYASWLASTSGEKLRNQWKKPGLQKAINLAGLLFCTGLAATSDAIWETILWAILAALFFIQLVLGFIRPHSPANTPPA